MPNPAVPDVPPAASLPPEETPPPAPAKGAAKPLKAAPIKPPADRRPSQSQTQTPVTPPVAGPLKAGDSRYTDRRGNPLSADEVFVDEGATRAVAATRIYEEYVLGGTKTRSVRLAYSEGTLVHRDEANRVREHCRQQAEAPVPDGQ